ncbi:1-deoxy-D-xylulose-5-phosphate synthase [Nocardia tenerifensis]|uniref:1-deoxy-D-xylulose-5-phosphate synthase n=3 Tax=Nocardia tenerifensis TaxID=228006 RepID=A0A318L0R6_9NOCA|nr:1-deoxy-D-xylulose-5-phosphate synthase [Nocardia tenerifensis]PXX71704.1 1-deoxy-D-xylulose-5-phosphate synthase [Nocardia tenerifensis]
MDILPTVDAPDDLRALDTSQLAQLASEIREFLVHKVAATGGHLGSNLGVVELTLAMHRAFDSPTDPFIFDTGHQAYVHKILTGRRDRFDELRLRDGLSGYPCRAESPHDWTESSHASAALSYADGLAKSFALTGQSHRSVVAVVGDGALTGGMCWEALNNIAAGSDRSIVVVVNDNGRSYAPTIGGLARRLAVLRMETGYERVLAAVKRFLPRVPVVGAALYRLLHALKEGLKDAVSPQMLFGDLGLKYVGPIDGHDTAALEAALRGAKAFGGPVIVHAVTRKGMGYQPAENHRVDQMHGPGPFDPATGRVLASTTNAQNWTSVFSAELIRLAARRDDIVAITAAMPGPTGLSAFGERFPERMFDVGIAEQHAVTSAAGLALGGRHPVVALYSTFLNRAFDQLLMDVALLHLPVTLVLDRAGVTGPDGASHHGVWDLALLGMIPGMRIAAPRDAASLRAELAEALSIDSGPTAVRFPKGDVGQDISAIEQLDGVDVLRPPQDGADGGVLIVAVGSAAATALAGATALRRQGVRVMVVDPRWVLPVPEILLKLAGDFRLVVTIEDGVLHGGVGSAVAARFAAAGIGVPVRSIGVPDRFLAHGSRTEILRDVGLDPETSTRRIAEWLATLDEP